MIAACMVKRTEECACEHEARFHRVELLMGFELLTKCRMVLCKCNAFEYKNDSPEKEGAA